MPGSVSPTWVSFVLAGIALLGPLGSAWVLSRRDDKRWERERRREDTRWERERRRDREVRDFNERKAAYAQAITALSSLLYFIQGWVHDRRNDPTLDLDQQKLDQLVPAVFDAAAVVELVGSAEVEACARAAIQDLTDYITVLSDFAPNEVPSTSADNRYFKSSASFQTLRAAAQRDIKTLTSSSHDDHAA